MKSRPVTVMGVPSVSPLGSGGSPGDADFQGPSEGWWAEAGQGRPSLGARETGFREGGEQHQAGPVLVVGKEEAVEGGARQPGRQS